MTVKELKELTATAPDDMIVYVAGVTALGAFAFQPACNGKSGPVTFGPSLDEDPDNPTPTEGFVIMPHGIAEFEDEDTDEETGPSADLN